jgi:hypothetical protein
VVAVQPGIDVEVLDAAAVDPGHGTYLLTVGGGETPCSHPGERGVPGDVDSSGEQLGHLPLVMGVQDVVEREPVGAEP